MENLKPAQAVETERTWQNETKETNFTRIQQRTNEMKKGFCIVWKNWKM
jgi:hypothetical protein